jgi:uncharacterized membrane protein
MIVPVPTARSLKIVVLPVLAPILTLVALPDPKLIVVAALLNRFAVVLVVTMSAELGPPIESPSEAVR